MATIIRDHWSPTGWAYENPEMPGCTSGRIAPPPGMVMCNCLLSALEHEQAIAIAQLTRDVARVKELQASPPDGYERWLALAHERLASFAAAAAREHAEDER